jgi:hypothetical protein
VPSSHRLITLSRVSLVFCEDPRSSFFNCRRRCPRLMVSSFCHTRGSKILTFCHLPSHVVMFTFTIINMRVVDPHLLSSLPRTVSNWFTPEKMRVQDPHISDSPHTIYSKCLVHTGKNESPGSSYFGLSSCHQHCRKYESPGSSYFGVTARHLQFASGVQQKI